MLISNEAQRKRVTLLRQWKASEEYHSLCSSMKNECMRLISIGERFLDSETMHNKAKRIEETKVEHAVGGDIHRGVYCPSPILDIVVGNLHRGRIVKRVSQATKLSHRFCFGENNEMIYCEEIQDGAVYSIEHVFTEGMFRYGVSHDREHNLSAVSEECFQDGKLISYKYIDIYPDNGNYFCANLHLESYQYDELGLAYAEKTEYQPYIDELQKYSYHFTREGGYLSTYTALAFPLIQGTIPSENYPVYRVSVKRKA